MTPLAFLVNTLVPTRYVQISDIMPLDNSAVETVAVLLVVPEASAATTINAHPPSLDEPMSEAVLAVRDLRAEEQGQRTPKFESRNGSSPISTAPCMTRRGTSSRRSTSRMERRPAESVGRATWKWPPSRFPAR